MYIHRIPFTRDSHKGPKGPQRAAKSTTATKPLVEEPAKIESIDEILEPVVEEAEVSSEESTDANS